jgi:hypothetical protein
MAIARSEDDIVTLVLIGKFNPSILQPRWMAGVNLFGEEEASEAKISLITQDTALFEVGEWLALHVTPERFQATGPFSHALKLRDLVIGLFTVLEHTPLAHLGINRGMHFRLTDGDERDALGGKLAPPGVWPTRFAAPKMSTLSMKGGRANSKANWTTVTVEPSTRIPDVGVFVASHEHYEFEGAEEAVKVLRSSFDDSVRFGREVAEALLSSGESQ